MNCYLDIETLPTQPEEEEKAEIAKTISAPAAMKKAETISDWHEGKGKYAGSKATAIEEAYRKTSLDGASGQVCSVAWKYEGAQHIYSESNDCDGGDYEVIYEFFYQLSKHLYKRPPFFIGHNITFDLQFIWRRAVILGINPPFILPFNGRHGKDFYCTMQAWAGYNKRISQDNLCKILGIEGKPGDICGANVWDHYKAGNIKLIEEYNRHDVETVEKIYNRINFI